MGLRPMRPVFKGGLTCYLNPNYDSCEFDGYLQDRKWHETEHKRGVKKKKVEKNRTENVCP